MLYNDSDIDALLSRFEHYTEGNHAVTTRTRLITKNSIAVREQKEERALCMLVQLLCIAQPRQGDEQYLDRIPAQHRFGKPPQSPFLPDSISDFDLFTDMLATAAAIATDAQCPFPINTQGKFVVADYAAFRKVTRDFIDEGLPNARRPICSLMKLDRLEYLVGDTHPVRKALAAPPPQTQAYHALHQASEALGRLHESLTAAAGEYYRDAIARMTYNKPLAAPLIGPDNAMINIPIIVMDKSGRLLTHDRHGRLLVEVVDEYNRPYRNPNLHDLADSKENWRLIYLPAAQGMTKENLPDDWQWAGRVIDAAHKSCASAQEMTGLFARHGGRVVVVEGKVKSYSSLRDSDTREDAHGALLEERYSTGEGFYYVQPTVILSSEYFLEPAMIHELKHHVNTDLRLVRDEMSKLTVTRYAQLAPAPVHTEPFSLVDQLALLQMAYVQPDSTVQQPRVTCLQDFHRDHLAQWMHYALLPFPSQFPPRMIDYRPEMFLDELICHESERLTYDGNRPPNSLLGAYQAHVSRPHAKLRMMGMYDEAEKYLNAFQNRHESIILGANARLQQSLTDNEGGNVHDIRTRCAASVLRHVDTALAQIREQALTPAMREALGAATPSAIRR